jgi:hypothetical protein
MRLPCLMQRTLRKERSGEVDADSGGPRRKQQKRELVSPASETMHQQLPAQGLKLEGGVKAEELRLLQQSRMI